MKRKTTFKIEMRTKNEATKFLANTNTAIGGIKLLQHHKEREIDPTIKQCWGCGRINPDHKTLNCPQHSLIICLKCGEKGHKFFNCQIPKELDKMNIYQKAARYCIPCGKRGDHTSLDHTFCPKKGKLYKTGLWKLGKKEMRKSMSVNVT